MCAAIIVGLIQLAYAIPFHQQPGQTTLLVLPSLFLLTMVLHVALAAYKYKEERSRIRNFSPGRYRSEVS
jgi:uncharacterized membrane protein YdbT with pleckstrin-like domain